MKPNIWRKCINCKVNCCKNKTISHILFLTKKETEKFQKVDINGRITCRFLDKRGLCSIYNERPTDCRLFPFDFVKKNNKLFWIYWLTDCPITGGGTEKDFESCLRNLETELIPEFKEYIEEYSKYKLTEFQDNFKKYKILREVRV